MNERRRYRLIQGNAVISTHASLATAGRAWAKRLKQVPALKRGWPGLWVSDFGMETLDDVTDRALAAAEEASK